MVILCCDVLGQVAEPLAGQVDRVGPGGVRVRVVALEHHVVLADDVEQPEAGLVLDERAEHVVLEQLADVGVEVERRLAHLLAPVVRGVHVDVEPRRPEALLVDDLLGPLEEVRDPADRALGQGDLEVREALEVPAEQPVEQRAGLVGGGRVGHEGERRHVVGGADQVRRRAHVHGDDDGRRRCAAWNTGSQKSVWIDGRPSLVGFSEKAIDLAPSAAVRSISAAASDRVPQRDDHHRDEPARVGAGELLEDEVVPRPDADRGRRPCPWPRGRPGRSSAGTTGRASTTARSPGPCRRRGRGLVAALAHVVVGDGLGRELLLGLAGDGVEAGGDDLAVLVDPELLAAVAHDARGDVAHLLGHPLLPEPRRLDEVVVDGDEPVDGHGGLQG